jgi:hypothetical protein
MQIANAKNHTGRVQIKEMPIYPGNQGFWTVPSWPGGSGTHLASTVAVLLKVRFTVATLTSISTGNVSRPNPGHLIKREKQYV